MSFESFFSFSFSTLVYPILNHIPFKGYQPGQNKTFSCLPVILIFNIFEMLKDMTMILLYQNESLEISFTTFAKQTKKCKRYFLFKSKRRKKHENFFYLYSIREIVHETFLNVSS